MKIVTAKKRDGRTVFVEHDVITLVRQIEDLFGRDHIAKKLGHIADYIKEQDDDLTDEELEVLEHIRDALARAAVRAIEWRDKIRAAITDAARNVTESQ